MAGGTGQSQTPMGGGESPLNTGGGMSGGQTQTPNFAAPQQQPMQQPTQQGQSIPSVFTPEQFKPYRWPPMTREEQHRNALAMGHIGNPGDKYLQQPQYQQPFGGFYGQQPQPMQNPFQPQQPSYMQDPEFQGYQTQVQDLNRQMNEYMQKAPMYQQLQDLQGKMSGYQQRYQQQELQRMQQMQQMQQYQQPSPFRRGQFQQPAGIQGLMGMLGGRSSGRDIGSYEQYVDRNNRALASPTQEVKRPTMSQAEWQAMNEQSRQPRMSMDMPYARGFASELPTYFMKKGGKV